MMSIVLRPKHESQEKVVPASASHLVSALVALVALVALAKKMKGFHEGGRDGFAPTVIHPAEP